MSEGSGERRRAPGDDDDRPIQEQLDEFSALIDALPGISPNRSPDEEIGEMYALMRKYPKAARGYADRLPT